MLTASVLPICAESSAEVSQQGAEVIHSQGATQDTGTADFGGVPVTYGVSEGYIVNIPSYIPLLPPTVSMQDHDQNPQTPAQSTTTLNPTVITLSARDVVLPRAKELTVYLTGSYSGEAWKLTSKDNPGQKLDYSISTDPEVKTNFIGMQDEVLNCPGGTATAENTLYFAVTGSPKLAGEYLDTITFNVEAVAK